jgi:signal transduction histidine kinase
MRSVERRRFFPYGVAVGSFLLATAVRLWIAPGLLERIPFATFFLATIVAAWIGGAGPGALALGLGALTARFGFGVVDTRLTAFVVVSTVVLVLSHVMRNARIHAERAGLEELEARRLAEAARERAAFLSDASIALTASLDYDATLATLANLVVPQIADWCAVDVVEAGDTIRRVAVAHRDLAKTALVDATRVYPPDPEGRHPRTDVIRTGRSRLIVDVTPERLEAMALHDEHLRVMREMGYVSAMIVALVARGRTLGAISCATMESARRYGSDDLALLEDLARRAALALDNARLYREAESARAEAERANRAKDDFLSVVSHELKTPLAATMGWLRVLRSGNGDSQPRALDTIERSMRLQGKLIDDLLDVSRMAAGQLHVDLRPLVLAEAVEAAVDLVRPEATAKGVRLDVVLDSRGAVVAGDPDRLQQIAWNLLVNAVKFTPASGVVQVRLACADGLAELVVRDTGRGIPPAFLPHVFERFRQAEPVATRGKGGLGLGLAITRHLVELHGGRVDVASDGEGAGSTFTVTLPLATADTAPARDVPSLDQRRRV